MPFPASPLTSADGRIRDSFDRARPYIRPLLRGNAARNSRRRAEENTRAAFSRGGGGGRGGEEGLPAGYDAAARVTAAGELARSRRVSGFRELPRARCIAGPFAAASRADPRADLERTPVDRVD